MDALDVQRTAFSSFFSVHIPLLLSASRVLNVEIDGDALVLGLHLSYCVCRFRWISTSQTSESGCAFILFRRNGIHDHAVHDHDDRLRAWQPDDDCCIYPLDFLGVAQTRGESISFQQWNIGVAIGITIASSACSDRLLYLDDGGIIFVISDYPCNSHEGILSIKNIVLLGTFNDSCNGYIHEYLLPGISIHSILNSRRQWWRCCIRLCHTMVIQFFGNDDIPYSFIFGVRWRYLLGKYAYDGLSKLYGYSDPGIRSIWCDLQSK